MFPPLYTEDFPLLSSNMMRSVIMGAINDLNDLILLLFLCLCVLEEKYCRRYIFSRDSNFLLKSDNYTMKIFKLFSDLELQVG